MTAAGHRGRRPGDEPVPSPAYAAAPGAARPGFATDRSVCPETGPETGPETAPANASGGPAASTPDATTPCAACTADPSGDLTFDVSTTPAAAPAYLLLRRRATDPSGREDVRLPLAPGGAGPLRAALGRGMALAEGRWDAYLLDSGGTLLRLAPGVHDLRALTDQKPYDDGAPVAVRIPYTTRQGDLAVRSWWRDPHAEAGELHIAEAALTVRGRIHGTGNASGGHAAAGLLTARAGAELRRRGAPHPVCRVRVVGDGVRFSCTFAYRELADVSPPGIWDLWLCPAGAGGPRVRVARLLDDVADKKPVFTYPAVRVTSRTGPVDVWPYYTVDNDLAVRVDAVDPVAPVGA